MQAGHMLTFGSYRLDVGRGQLWRGTQEVKLTPKGLAVLRHVVERAGQVVTKEELLQVGWPDTVVSEAARTVCIRELRQTLRDDARKPRYLETVHRRGFRFVAAVTAATVSCSKFQVSSPNKERAETSLPTSGDYAAGLGPS